MDSNGYTNCPIMSTQWMQPPQLPTPLTFPEISNLCESHPRSIPVLSAVFPWWLRAPMAAKQLWRVGGSLSSCFGRFVDSWHFLSCHGDFYQMFNTKYTKYFRVKGSQLISFVDKASFDCWSAIRKTLSSTACSMTHIISYLNPHVFLITDM